jgi:hypothetical protein
MISVVIEQCRDSLFERAVPSHLNGGFESRRPEASRELDEALGVIGGRLA